MVPDTISPPFGAVSTLQDGCVGSGCTPLQESYFYNTRLQTAVEELGTSSNHSQDSCRVYNYYARVANAGSCSEAPSGWPSGSNNNGNVAGYYFNDNVNTDLTHTAKYTYDAVNRLVIASATPFDSGTVAYSRNYTYDQYGNMSCAPAGPGCVALTYNSSTNQITNAGYWYGDRGNVSGDGTYSYWWEMEGRLYYAYNGAGTTISSTTYNALRQRVRDITLSSTTDEAYGAGGELLWRYTGNPSTNRSFVPLGGRILAEYLSGGTLFDHPNELGSISTSSDYTGKNFAERLFYPFGELWTGADPNNFAMHQIYAKLPDYDAEIDLYNTPNRHYSPNGRWPSPYPPNSGVDRSDPQTWNAYAYVRNNPTSLSDPTGLCGGNDYKPCTGFSGDTPVDGVVTGPEARGPLKPAQNQSSTSAIYPGGNLIVAQNTTTTTSTDANGTTTTVISTTASFRTDPGHEGEFYSAHQDVTTTVTSAQGTVLSQSDTGSASIDQGRAAQSIGSATINSAIAQTVPGLATTIGRDLVAHKGDLARSAVEGALLFTPVGEAYEGAKVSVEAWWAAMGALKAATSPP